MRGWAGIEVLESSHESPGEIMMFMVLKNGRDEHVDIEPASVVEGIVDLLLRDHSPGGFDYGELARWSRRRHSRPSVCPGIVGSHGPKRNIRSENRLPGERVRLPSTRAPGARVPEPKRRVAERTLRFDGLVGGESVHVK